MIKKIWFWCEAHGDLYGINEGCPYHFAEFNLDELFECSGGVCWAGCGWCELTYKELVKLRGKKYNWFGEQGNNLDEMEKSLSKAVFSYKMAKEAKKG